MHHCAVTPKRNGGRRGQWTVQAERLLDLLNALGSTIFRQFLWQRAAELDLTYAQGQVLFHVAAHPGCRMGDIGKAFAVTLPAVTHLVDRLEEKGFVTRADDPVDRRAYVLEVTRGGAALVDELNAMRLRSLEAVLARMSAGDRARVVRGLEALVDASVEAAER
jgi:DNA-binding MarR family transcriptional regulator